MPMFRYIGRNTKGERVEGRLEAAAPDKLADQLAGLGIIPITIRPDEAKPALGLQLRAHLGSSRIKTVDLIFFSRQMYTMLRAGVPILQAMDGLLTSTSNAALIEVIRKIREGLASGLDLSAALRAHPDVFSRLYLSMVQMGETTGNVGESFRSMGDFLEQEKELVQRVKGALRYPVIVLIAITLAMVVINIKVIPAFAGMFEKLGTDLPLATRFLMASSHLFTHYWPLMLVGLGAAIYGVRAVLATPAGRLAWDKAKLDLPIFGKIIRWSTLARFTRALAVTNKAGVPIAQALPLVGGAMDNRFVERRVLEMQNKIEQGMSFAKSAELSGLFPPLVLQMLRIGEETGDLDELIVEVAGYYEREVDYNIKNLSSLIEPLLILVIGIMVLVIALGVFMPMWGMLDAARKH